jgi:hypothetical protein
VNPHQPSFAFAASRHALHQQTDENPRDRKDERHAEPNQNRSEVRHMLPSYGEANAGKNQAAHYETDKESARA